MLNKKPTKKQQQVLDFIEKFKAEKKYSPSLEEIAKHFGISIPTAHQHIDLLKKKNILNTQRGQKRSIELYNNRSNDMVVEIPLLGIISAGGPIEAINNPEPLSVPKSILSKTGDHYALRVSGVSMIEEGIFDGDIVIVRNQPSVENGEKAVAYLPDQDKVTLKKIYKEKDRIRLQPANKEMQPFYEKKVEIQGKVVGIMRKE